MPDKMEDAVTLPLTDAYDDVDLTEVRLQARQGSLPALLYRPRAEGPWPAVVLAAEAYGINTFTRRVAATLAHLGYVTLVPDYYRGEGPTDPETTYWNCSTLWKCVGISSTCAPWTAR